MVRWGEVWCSVFLKTTFQKKGGQLSEEYMMCVGRIHDGDLCIFCCKMGVSGHMGLFFFFKLFFIGNI